MHFSLMPSLSNSLSSTFCVSTSTTDGSKEQYKPSRMQFFSTNSSLHDSQESKRAGKVEMRGVKGVYSAERIEWIFVKPSKSKETKS